MTPADATLVRESWARLLPMRKQVCADFYQRLFQRHPELRPLFKGDMERQASLFTTMMNTVVSALDNPDPVVPLVRMAGARHADYGVAPEHYGKFREALLASFAEALGADFTPQVRTAWTEAYAELARTMQQGAEELRIGRP
ncbi:hemin receptor [Thiohalocapsa marina]|uniref:Hemin receptor n=1 Tax=Thiohalocapsa marina TaxID=424902 RepID=A0A5M8FPD9_9GAMM|nr:globin domain-containing protein [Thiohalocapsa marina]KAA6186639.1 hemin receptor [Thiohalocapsa marina]